jgi:ABC-type transporter Mla MlaB component
MGRHTDGEPKFVFTEQPDAHVIHWIGKAHEHRPAQFLTPLFETVLLCANKRVELDLSQLQQISSPTLVLVIQFLKSARERGLHTDVKYDSTVGWQRATFDRLRNLTTSANPSLQPAA